MAVGSVPLEGDFPEFITRRSFAVKESYPILSKSFRSTSSNEGYPGNECEGRGIDGLNDGG